MMENSSDTGYELVLDNRRLIIAFVVLILICGCFFVLGFVEGKRQGYQAGSQTAVEPLAEQTPEEPKEIDSETAVADSETPALKEETEKQVLNWYKNVSGQAAKKETIPPPPKPAPALKSQPAKPATADTLASSVTYTVQVGAFRQRQQAEARIKSLRQKGFDCRIEAPPSSGDLYLVKVGRYKTRAEAAAAQLSLKKNGFDAFIKAN